MRGLKIIPLFLVLIVMSYIGVIFVQNNPDESVIRFFNQYESPPLPLGFIILTSALVGMLAAGILCVLELVVLYLQNKSLKRKLDELGQNSTASFREIISDTMTAVPQADAVPEAIEDTSAGEQIDAAPISDVPPPPPSAPEANDDSDDEDIKRDELEIKSPTELN